MVETLRKCRHWVYRKLSIVTNLTQQPANPKQFGFLWIWHNTTRVDLRTQYAQYSNLRRHELKLSVVSRATPFQSQSQQRERHSIHFPTSRLQERSKKLKESAYLTTATFSNLHKAEVMVRSFLSFARSFGEKTMKNLFALICRSYPKLSIGGPCFE